MKPSPFTSHPVRCQYCFEGFELFNAAWCQHRDEPSKICPHCGQCLCAHPAYAERHFWKPAPPGFQKRGFRRLFLYYL